MDEPDTIQYKSSTFWMYLRSLWWIYFAISVIHFEDLNWIFKYIWLTVPREPVSLTNIYICRWNLEYYNQIRIYYSYIRFVLTLQKSAEMLNTVRFTFLSTPTERNFIISKWKKGAAGWLTPRHMPIHFQCTLSFLSRNERSILTNKIWKTDLIFHLITFQFTFLYTIRTYIFLICYLRLK